MGLLPNAVLILSCRGQRRERRTNIKVEDPSSSSLNQEGDKHVSVHHSASVMAVCAVTRSCPAPCDPLDCSSSDSSVCEISQTRIPACVAIPPPGESSDQGSNPRPLRLLRSLHRGAPMEAALRFFAVDRIWLKKSAPIWSPMCGCHDLSLRHQEQHSLATQSSDENLPVLLFFAFLLKEALSNQNGKNVLRREKIKISYLEPRVH